MLACSILLVSVPMGFHSVVWAQPNDNQSLYGYNDYVTQANSAIEKGDLSAAIDLFEKAMPLAPDQSKSVILNNLAAIYMRRGNFFHDKKKQDDLALSDYRKAYYLLDLGWPEGLEKKPLYLNNLKIAKDNLRIAYTNLKISLTDKEVHHKMAKELRMQGKFKEAIVEYAKIVEIEPGNGDAMKAIGDLFNVMNQPEKSKKYYALAVKAQGTNVKDDTLVQLANAQNKAGQINDAIASLNKALETNPNNMSALSQLETIWKNEIKFNPASVLGHANLAGIYQKMKRYDEALNQYNAAEYFANQDPKTPFEVKKLIRLNTGTLFQETKKYEQALNAYDTILQADRQNQLATLYKARLFRDLGRLDDAVRWYRNVLTLDPNNATAHQEILEMILKQTDPTKMAVGLKSYGDQFPDNAIVQSKVGEEFHRMKDYNNAATYYQRAIQLKPDMASAHANLGAVLQALGKEDESLVELKKAEALDPKNETVKTLAKETEASSGYKSYQKAVELQQAGKYAESIDYFKKALAVTPNDAQMIAAYGIALQNTSQFTEAMAQYEKAIGIDEKNGTYHYYLATAYHQNKQLDKALMEYKKAVALDGTLGEAKKAIASLE
ncbi:MAG: tetratricopeptide repeat protein, partial [Cyanobacteria bacterium]|nr:tetratricopeptide repeat protein [Cyanobacteriota bacterium]